MPNKITIFVSALFFLSLFVAFAPIAVSAQTDTGLVPCGNVAGADGKISNPCGWNDLIKLVNNIANFFIIAGTAISALAFGYAGFLMMTSAGEMSKIEKAKSIFGKVVIGFLIMLSAWLIVNAIEVAFIKDTSFQSLLGSKQNVTSSPARP